MGAGIELHRISTDTSATQCQGQGLVNSTSASTNQIDAIVLDYSLPDGNGLEFLAKLQAQSHGNIPPVVMITGKGDENIAVQAIKLGAQDYIATTETIDSLAPPPTFSIVIAPDLPTFNTKRILLFQVFTNLIGNAIVHHNRSDGSIQISCQESDDFYEFGVTDDGPGIAPINHAKIFTIFQAVNPQNRADSTGIGLAIVKKIVEAEGGTIRLESELGKGTAFYFTWSKSSN